MDDKINKQRESKTTDKEKETVEKKKGSGFITFLYSGGILIFLVLGFVLVVAFFVISK